MKTQKGSHLQDIMLIVRLALYAPSCITNVRSFSAIFLLEECLQSRGLLTVFFLAQRQFKTFRRPSHTLEATSTGAAGA